MGQIVDAETAGARAALSETLVFLSHLFDNYLTMCVSVQNASVKDSGDKSCQELKSRFEKMVPYLLREHSSFAITKERQFKLLSLRCAAVEHRRVNHFVMALTERLVSIATNRVARTLRNR